MNRKVVIENHILNIFLPRAIVLSPATGVPLETSSEIVERKMVS